MWKGTSIFRKIRSEGKLNKKKKKKSTIAGCRSFKDSFFVPIQSKPVTLFAPSLKKSVQIYLCIFSRVLKKKEWSIWLKTRKRTSKERWKKGWKVGNKKGKKMMRKRQGNLESLIVQTRGGGECNKNSSKANK